MLGMQDKTIDNALLALRKQIIRAGGKGLNHVEVLLRQRGADMPRVMPPKRQDAAKRGHMRLLVLEALIDGPKPLTGIAEYVSARRPEIDYSVAYTRCGQCLAKLRNAGRVRREGRMWRNRR